MGWLITVGLGAPSTQPHCILRLWRHAMVASRAFRSCTTFVFSVIYLSAPAASAQDQQDIDSAWLHFLDRCTFAYNDPQRYLDDISVRQGPSTENLGNTADHKIVWGGISNEKFGDGMFLTEVGGRRLQSCEADGLLDGSPESATAANEAFLKEIASRPGVTVAGGPIPEISLGAGGVAGIGANTYRYVVHGALPDDILAEIVITPWDVSIVSSTAAEGR